MDLSFLKQPNLKKELETLASLLRFQKKDYTMKNSVRFGSNT